MTARRDERCDGDAMLELSEFDCFPSLLGVFEGSSGITGMQVVQWVRPSAVNPQ